MKAPGSPDGTAKNDVPRYLDPIAKAQANPHSRTLAIRAKCWSCCGAGADGQKVTRTSISTCPVTVCPLHPVRPYQDKAPSDGS
jgi:hypothetical protein